MHIIPPPRQILHNLCFSFLMGIATFPREIENNAYAKFFGGGKYGALWEMRKWRMNWSRVSKKYALGQT